MYEHADIKVIVELHHVTFVTSLCCVFTCDPRCDQCFSFEKLHHASRDRGRDIAIAIEISDMTLVIGPSLQPAYHTAPIINYMVTVHAHEQAIYYRTPSIFGRAKRKSPKGNIPITCLNIL